MGAFNQVLNLLQMCVAGYGTWMLVNGLVTFGGGFSNHQGTDMKDGGAKIIGGAAIILGATIISQIKLG